MVGLNRVIIDREEAFTEDNIEDEFKKRLEKIAGTDFDVYIWPESSSDDKEERRHGEAQLKKTRRRLSSPRQ